MSAQRVAIGGFLHETNTFGPSKATYADFVSGGGAGRMVEGEAIAATLSGTNVAIAGALAHAAEAGWTVVPTLWCATSPSAHVTEDAFERIAGRLVDLIAAAMPLDGVFLDLHGAMVTEHLDDGEGELLRRLRARLGTGLGAVPIVASLDLHANVTPQMVDLADALESYRTYPHVDMADTGRRAAAMLGRIMAEGRPAKAFRQAPFLTAIAWQSTDNAPAGRLYARVADLSREGTAVSFNMGFPAADIPGCGMSVAAYGPAADRAADALMADIVAAEPEFAGTVYAPDEAIARALSLAAKASRPVVVSDTQDNPGAGADSDTTGMLRALLAAGTEAPMAIGNLYDPDSAARAHAAGEGATVRLALGGKSRVPGDAPFEAEFLVERLTDGRFLAPGPFYGGRAMEMGPSACLRLGPVRIALVSAKAQMADRAMFETLGIPVARQTVVVVKSSVHFRADFAPAAAAILVARAPGPMAVDPSTLPWRRLRPGLRTAPGGPAFEPPAYQPPA
ncbi:MAG: M81 family metallopeptidase [Pseudomonadota bacterium]